MASGNNFASDVFYDRVLALINANRAKVVVGWLASNIITKMNNFGIRIPRAVES